MKYTQSPQPPKNMLKGFPRLELSRQPNRYRISKVPQLVLCYTVALLFSSSAHAVQYVNLGMESTSFDLDAVNIDTPTDVANVEAGNQTAYHFLEEDNDTYDMPFTGLSYNPWISGSISYEGSKSLGLRIPSTNTTKDRIELRAVHGVNDSYKLKFGQNRYFGFAIYIHPNSEPNASWLHCVQAWQRGAGFVPFTMGIYKSGNDFRFRMDARDSSGSTLLKTGSITPGQWYTFVFHFRPQHSTNGKIRCWRNGTSILDWTGSYGAEPGTGDNAVNGMDCRVGMYRDSQNSEQIFFVDNVKFASSKSQATP